MKCEANVLRFVPLDGVIVRFGRDTDSESLAIIREAAMVSGVPVDRSDASVETDAELAGRIGGIGAERIRVLGPVSDELLRACHRAGIAVDRAPVTSEGMVELQHWVREQSVSRTMHRYGRLVGHRQGRPSSGRPR